MLAGHYTAAFVGKAAQPRAPWWLLLVAAQFVDVVWAFLVLTGVERAGLDYTLPTNPLVGEYMPYTHSLLGSAAWAGLAGLIVWKRKGSTRLAGLIAAVVLSHWFLDLLVHRPDLTLAGFEPKLGLRLWNYPVLSQVFELGLLVLSYQVFRRWAHPNAREVKTALILLAVLFVVQLYSLFAPPPASVPQMAVSLLVFWLGLAAWAGWVESRSPPPSEAAAPPR